MMTPPLFTIFSVCGLQSSVCSLRSAVCSLQMSYTAFPFPFKRLPRRLAPISLRNCGLISNEEMHTYMENREHIFTTLYNLFLSLTDGPICSSSKTFCVVIFLQETACVSKLGNGPEAGKCPAPGQCKICKCPTPGTDKAGKCPAVVRLMGVGAGGID